MKKLLCLLTLLSINSAIKAESNYTDYLKIGAGLGAFGVTSYALGTYGAAAISKSVELMYACFVGIKRLEKDKVADLNMPGQWKSEQMADIGAAPKSKLWSNFLIGTLPLVIPAAIGYLYFNK